MWKLTVPWYDPVLRGLIIYLCIFFLLRFIGKRQLSRFTPFDLILLIIVSEAIQNGLTGNDHSMTGALIAVTTIIVLNTIFNQLIASFAWFEKLMTAQPVVIVLNGKIFKKVMREQRITEAELLEALREHEIMNPEDVKCAILEKDGNISVIKYAH